MAENMREEMYDAARTNILNAALKENTELKEKIGRMTAERTKTEHDLEEQLKDARKEIGILVEALNNSKSINEQLKNTIVKMAMEGVFA